ncbi:MAG: LysR family transcriptional regulator [Alphaproteobacteria bacterium]|nr:LysR family transcriptional regulator [Alphaproteobacteria bacterium]
MASLRRRHMLVFQTVMRSRSVTEAAQQLGISQPATSRALFELEEQVGFPLFNRSSGRTTPTVEAQNLLPEIDELLLHQDLVEGRIKAVRARNEGTLTIAAPPGLVTSFLSRAVAR